MGSWGCRLTRLRPAVRRLVKTRVSAWALSIPHVRLSSHTPAGRKQLTHSRVEAAGRDRWGLWYFWRRYLPESIPTWLHGGAAEHVGPKPRTCSPCGGGDTRGGGQAGGRVTRSGCSPDSLQPGRVGAQRHAEAAAEPDAAVRGDQPAPARFPPAVPGPRLVPLPHPGGNETGDRSTQPFPGEGGGLGAWRGTAHSPGCRDTADPAACGPSGRSLALTACF